MAVLEQVGDFLLESLAFLGQFAFGPGRATSSELGLLGGELLAHLGHRSQDSLVQVFEDVELADLMRHRAKDGLNRHWIQGRAIGGNAAHGQLPCLQDRLKMPEKDNHVLVCGVMVQDLVIETLEGMVVYNGQHAKGSIVEFINGEVAGKVGQGPGQIIGLPPFTRPFPPPPPPSSGWWQREQTRDGHARDANSRCGTAGHLPPPPAPPTP